MTRKLWQVTISVFLLFGLVMGLVQLFPTQASSAQRSTVSRVGKEKIKPDNLYTMQAALPLQVSMLPKDQGIGIPELGVAPKIVKGVETTTKGNAIQALWPGPDGYNYKGSSCIFNWVDITTTGTEITGLGEDNYQGPFNIGFTFPFYGGNQSQFYANSNGFLSFGAGSDSFSNQCPLPKATAPNNLIAMLWDDLTFIVGGSAYYQTFDSCPVGSGQCLVVEYYNIAHYIGISPTPGSAGTWETILYPSGKATLQFLSAGNELGSSSTTGIENNNFASNYGLTYACDTPESLSNTSCLSFVVTPTPDLHKSVKTARSVVQPGNLLTYKVSIFNSGTGDASSTTMVDPIPAGTTFDHLITAGLVYNSALTQVEWSGSVDAGAQVDLEFVVTVDDPSTCGVEILNTAVISDPAALTPVSVQAMTGIWDNIYYSQDFENSNGDFSTSGTSSSWAWGDVGVYVGTHVPAPSGAHSGTKVWATNLTGDYNESEDSYLTSAVIDLSSAVSVPGFPLELEWWQWLRTESGSDYASVEVRGGSTPWMLVYGPVSGDINQTWTKHVIDISQFARHSDFQVRFHLNTDPSVNRPGWYLDDLAIHQCAPPPGLVLSPEIIESTGCNGSHQVYAIDLFNNTNSGGVFNLSYWMDPAYGTLTGPTSVSLANKAGQNFNVTLSQDFCLVGGTYINTSVSASGNGYTDTSYINHTISTSGIWEKIADEPAFGRMDNVLAAYAGKVWSITGYGSDANVRYYTPSSNTWTVVGTPAPFGVNYAYSGCQVDNKVFMYGDAATEGFMGLWSYNMTSGLWITETPSGAPPAYLGISAPAWVRDPTSGYCYMTGGASAPGAGDLATVYVYDPVTNTWLSPLPNFTTARNYHAAFVFERPLDTHSLLCVAGGYNYPLGKLSNTQCFDLNTGGWGVENADLGALPAEMWGMGYAQKLHAGTHPQLWLVGGVAANTLTMGTTYYDVLTGIWQDGGDLTSAAVYRTAAVTLNNEIYKLGGTVGGFNFTGKADHHIQCPSCTDIGWLNGRVYDFNGTDPTVTLANIHLEPGNIDIPVDANGYYTATLTPFTYHATASAVNYSTPVGPVDVTVSTGFIVTQNFTLSRPDIDINTTGVSVVVIAPGMITSNITIINQGTSQLDWEINEAQAALIANAKYQASPFDLAKSPMAIGLAQVESQQSEKIVAGGLVGNLFNSIMTLGAAQDFYSADWLPWVSESPITGTISAPGQQVVQLTFTCSITDSQQTQPLEGVLKINHNDPEPPNPREVNLSMFCVSQNTVLADFSATPRSGIAPLNVAFTNLSTGDFTSSLWDFGDGGTSTQASPAHTYTVPGVYTVMLTVSGPGGTDTETKAGYITVRYGNYLPMTVRNSQGVAAVNQDMPAWKPGYLLGDNLSVNPRLIQRILMLLIIGIGMVGLLQNRQ